ncbi:MAG: inositol monophosphatase [Polyangiaceae bacterium]
MDPASAERLCQIALQTARQAGAVALGGYRRPLTVALKGDKDLVTEFDLSTERFVRERLAELTPEIPVFGEEEGGAEVGLTWFCDPIDGTANFAHGHPFWAVSLGLMNQGEALLGAVVAPALGLHWHGVASTAAFRNDEPCRVSDGSELSAALAATGFPRARDRAPDNNFDSFVHVKKRIQGVRRCGAASIDVCLVADGTYDFYWERKLSTWDLAAGVAIARAAGAIVSDLRGGAADLSRGRVIVSNPHLHAQAVALIAESEDP